MGSGLSKLLFSVAPAQAGAQLALQLRATGVMDPCLRRGDGVNLILGEVL